MPGEHIDPPSGQPNPSGLHLIPCAVVAGVQAPAHDDRLYAAQSALNRVQVWIGDLVRDLVHRRDARRLVLSRPKGR